MTVHLSDLPTAGFVAMKAAKAAGVEVEISVIVQVRAGDAADDADDRKIMADYHDVVGVRMAFDDAFEPLPGALGDVGQAFTARNLEFSRFVAPAN